MSEQARGSAVAKPAVGVLVGLSIVMAVLLLAFAIFAGYSVGKDLALRDNARGHAVAGH